MDKIAMYKEQIYKEAMSRKWKEMIGTLSNDNIKKLQKADILDHGKELLGLKKGTENIVKKHNGVIGHFTSEEYANAFKKEINHNKFLQKAIKDNAEKGSSPIASEINKLKAKKNILNAMKNMHDSNNGFATINGNKIKLVSRGKLSNKGFIADAMEGLPRKKRDREYLSAIFDRHEADELRFGQNSFKGKKNNISYKGSKAPAGSFASHLSPKVLGAESVNAAVAPPSVKSKLENLRATTGESKGLTAADGFEYGKSGKYNKKVNAKMQRMQVAYNKPMYKDVYKE